MTPRWVAVINNGNNEVVAVCLGRPSVMLIFYMQFVRFDEEVIYAAQIGGLVQELDTNQDFRNVSFYFVALRWPYDSLWLHENNRYWARDVDLECLIRPHNVFSCVLPAGIISTYLPCRPDVVLPFTSRSPLSFALSRQLISYRSRRLLCLVTIPAGS